MPFRNIFIYMLFDILLLLCRAHRNEDCCANQKSRSEILFKGKSLPSLLGLYNESCGPIIRIYASF